MRLFVALLLEEEAREEIYGAIRPIRESELPVRWVDASSLHLTLKFLGDTTRRTLPSIESALASAAAKTRRFDLQLGGLGAFPTLRNPRVLWIGVDATPPLRCLKQDIEWELSPVGFPREIRAFQPHLTVGRARKNARAGDFRGLEALSRNIDHELSVPMTEVHLMKSRLSPGGAKYERIATLPLG